MISRQWFVNHALDNIELFVSRALSVDDKYVRIANGDPEFFAELQKDFESFKPEDLEGYESEVIELEDILFGEYERATAVLLDYQDIVVRAALNEINSIVEYELVVHSSFALSKKSGKSLAECWVKHRERAHKTIKEIYDVEVESLQGYFEIDEVRKMINAYKHDDGYSKEDYEPFLKDHVKQKKYELNSDEISKYVDAAKTFLGALPGEKLELGMDVVKRLKKNNFGSKS